MTGTPATETPAHALVDALTRSRNKAAAVTVLLALAAAVLVGGVGYFVRAGQVADRQHVSAQLATYPEAIGEGREAVALVSYTTNDGIPRQNRALVDILANYGETTAVWVTNDGVMAEAPLWLRLRLRLLAFSAAMTALATLLSGYILSVRDRHETYLDARDTGIQAATT